MKATRADVQAALGELDGSVVNIEDHERRKHTAATKQRRQDLSDDALLLECLFDLYQFDSDERGFLHGLVARSLGKSPEQRVLVNEVELGRLLPGHGDVLEGSVKKRVRRMFAQIDAKQRAAGRLAVDRKDGQCVLGEGKQGAKRFAARGEKKLVSAEWFFPVVQAVVDGVDMARPGRERRIVRFRRAARVVFEALPECRPHPPKAKETPALRAASDAEAAFVVDPVTDTAAGRERAETPKPPRPVKKVKDNAALALRLAKERDARRGDGRADEFDRQAAALYVELSRTVAEVQGEDAADPAEVLRQTIARLQAMLEAPGILSSISSNVDSLATGSIVDNETGAAGVREFPAPETPKPQQNRPSGPRKLDKSVQAKRRLPGDFVQRVRDDADLVRLVTDAGVTLKRAGGEYKGCCPFHEEKTPSFSVNPAKGLFHCYGCQRGGNVFNFVMESQGLGFREAVEHVAASCGIPMPDDEGERPKAGRAVREPHVEPDTEYADSLAARSDYFGEGPPDGLEVYDL